jgi:predicted transcriptional regulator
MEFQKRPRTRATRAQMETRRARILAAIQAAWSYEEIAAREGLTRERVRQIVVEMLKARGEDRLDRNLLHEARLEPAIRLASKAIIEGKLEGVDRLVKAIGLSSRLVRPGKPPRVYNENTRQRLLDKLNMNYNKILDKEERDAERESARAASGTNLPEPGL